MAEPMSLAVFSGLAHVDLARAVCERLGVALGRCAIERFPDGELHVEVQESVRGRDVYLVQPTSPPAERHLLELLLLADACRRAGARALTAAIPYFGYARQDRRAGAREAVGARLVADLIKTSGVQRVVAVDLHTPSLEGFFSIPLEHLSAVRALAEAARSVIPSASVVVAPDLGAARLAQRYARLLDLPMALVQKTRLSGEEVSVQSVAGPVAGRAPLVVDDMISTGGTIEGAVQALLQAGSLPDVTIVASHALLVGRAVERLSALPVRRLIVADSVAVPPTAPLPCQVVSLAPLLAEAIERLHHERSLDDLLRD